MDSLLKVRIRNLHEAAEAVRSYELVALDGGELPAFSAGAHIDLHLPSGLIRQYSLWNAPGETHRYCIAVLRDPASRGGSQEVHERLQEGDHLTISAPRNHFALQAGKRVRLFAGGIGITPILAMAYELQQQQREFELHYSFRQRSQAALLEYLQDGPLASRSHLHCSGEGSRMDSAQALANPAADEQLYVCGSQGFIDQILASARAAGWADSQLHREYFNVETPVSDVPAGSFEVRVGNRSFNVGADQTVADVLAANGLAVAVSCGKGICGSCLTTVLEGEPDHRDLYLTEEEQAANDQFTPCCSRAKSSYLVLDLPG